MKMKEIGPMGVSLAPLRSANEHKQLNVCISNFYMKGVLRIITAEVDSGRGQEHY